MPHSQHARCYTVTRNAAALLTFTLVVTASIFYATHVGAAGGDVDTTFNTGVGASNSVFALAVQPDGKILIGGDFTTVNGATRNRVARLLANGGLDLTFDSGADVGANSTVRNVVLQPDGKILIGGFFTAVGGVARNRIARLNADGSLDTLFDPGTGANESVSAVRLQPDGKILVGGSFTGVGGVARNNIARLNTDGSLDTSFDTSVGANSTVSAIALQPDGKILIGGLFTAAGGLTRPRIARLEANGNVDASFDPVAGASDLVSAVEVQSDGKVVIGGAFTNVNGTARNRIARLNSNGSLDPTFDTSVGANNAVRAIAIQSDGKVLIGGFLTSVGGVARNRIARLNTNGSLDTTFAPGTGANSTVLAVGVQTDGKVLIGGQFTTVGGVGRNRIARLLAAPGTLAFATGAVGVNEDAGTVSVAVTRTGGTDNTVIAKVSVANGSATRPDDYRFTPGTLDTTFNPNADDEVRTLALQPDGKIIIGGDFTVIDGVARNRIARLNSNGSLDATFDPGTAALGDVLAIALQSDGKILIGGGVTRVNEMALERIARLNPDGSLDASFDASAAGRDGGVLNIGVQPDGKILIVGSFTTVNNVARNYIARLNSNGSLDTTFDVGAGADEDVEALALQADGKVIVGGIFTRVNNVARKYVARLNTNGSVDTTFNVGAGANNAVRRIAIQPDGKIFISGPFTTVSGMSHARIARLNANGGVDTTFNSGLVTDTGYFVHSFALQLDGKVIVGGAFSRFSNATGKLVERLNANGSLDTTFDTSEDSASGLVRATVVQPDGKVVIGGSFMNFDGVAGTRIARLDNDIFVTFPAGDATSKTFTLPIVNDTFEESNETFTLTLTAVGTGGATLGTPATATVTILANDSPPVALAPAADTWVQGADAFRNTNFGADPALQVKRTFNAGAGRGRRGFLRFNTAVVAGNVTSARLSIFARLADASLPPTGMIIQKVTDTTWNEATMTWNNQPGVESPNALAQITVTNAEGSFYEFDLTSFIQQERAAGRNVVSLRLINQQSTGNSGASFTSVNSKEAASNRPQLIMTVAPSSP